MRGRLGARGVGFRSVFVRSALVAFVSVRSALVVSVAPVTHPASSGSQTWWQVLWWGVRRFVRFVRFRTFGALVVSVAPVTHPASSGSQTWWQVLWWGVRRFVRFVCFRTLGPRCVRYVAFVRVSSPPLTVA